jgi:hypothetical protein
MPSSNESPKTLGELIARACDAYSRDYNTELAAAWKTSFGSVSIADLYEGLVAHQRNTSLDPRDGRPVGRWFPTAADILAQVEAAHRRNGVRKTGRFGRQYCGGSECLNGWIEVSRDASNTIRVSRCPECAALWATPEGITR